ncbi:alpha-glucosidase [Saccharopolyspora erythraea NRRL 2338]|uniref:Alpha-glucosidase n=2 Tax=Saccharopolyspora erythraea TaxID=1836 RepID=A4FN07_SACEN|nr:alpha-amylase family glycosyl hydrolase [Saccharopolyspora erythraea]EQD82579.1 glycosidase [Saccharopolyspora erythraea D]PFG99075.1 alpha-glucosidase [Saccharopolyspora erythraea NRRL 2338]QRK89037.1 glycoside hydrolase family 13 protein [Saccharopolyspora erythraea]CAM05432.1 alpha-glucosidase [Saccharopolyspora erythraea NRRL 2338]
MSRNWWRNAVIYQIYPRSFVDSDGNGIGDLAGITSRMDYLAGLGVDAVWLSPFYPSPWADGGYDVADYRDVDPSLGTLEDFDRLVAAAHERDIRVLIDIVPNHTSDQHEWFRQALASPAGSPERDRYVFRDGKGHAGEHPPSNWESRFGGPAWTRLPDGQWYMHLFAKEQPDLNWDNPDVRAEFLDILRFWSRRGVDGFRIDVAAALVKDMSEPLRDVVGGEGTTGLDDLAANPDHPFLDRPEVHDVYREWNKVFHEFDPPRIGVAEAWVQNERRVRYTRTDELQQAFNFEFLRVRWDAPEYRRVVQESISGAKSVGTVATWVMSNHDVVRHVSALGLPAETDLRVWLSTHGTHPAPDLELGTRRARAAVLFTLGLPGSAYVYQGEELGLPEVADLPVEVLEDPKYERTNHKEKGRDGCRVPLPWTRDGVSAGFSTEPGWLPQPEGWGERSVEAQEGDEESMLELYRTALRLRREFAADESFEWEPTHNTGDVLAFRRADNILVLVNTGSEAVPLPVGEVVLSSIKLDGDTLPGNSAVWLRVG